MNQGTSLVCRLKSRLRGRNDGFAARPHDPPKTSKPVTREVSAERMSVNRRILLAALKAQDGDAWLSRTASHLRSGSARGRHDETPEPSVPQRGRPSTSWGRGVPADRRIVGGFPDDALRLIRRFASRPLDALTELMKASALPGPPGRAPTAWVNPTSASGRSVYRVWKRWSRRE